MSKKLLTAISSIAFITASSAYAQVPAVPQTATANILSAPQALGLPVARDGEVIDSIGGGAIDAIVAGVQTVGGISYITGGIGDEELAEMKAQEINFNVRILIAGVDGEYMGGVALRILDSKDAEIFRVDSAGPFFFVNLPAGKYTAEAATEGGVIQTTKITASAKIPATGIKSVIRFK